MRSEPPTPPVSIWNAMTCKPSIKSHKVGIDSEQPLRITGDHRGHVPVLSAHTDTYLTCTGTQLHTRRHSAAHMQAHSHTHTDSHQQPGGHIAEAEFQGHEGARVASAPSVEL